MIDQHRSIHQLDKMIVAARWNQNLWMEYSHPSQKPHSHALRAYAENKLFPRGPLLRKHAQQTALKSLGHRIFYAMLNNSRQLLS
jgi:hypothetical protein